VEMIKEGEIEQEYNGLMTRISGEFANELGYRNAENYVKGLLGTAERKNGWQLSEYIGENSPYKMQQFLYRGEYSAEGLRDELRSYVGEKLGEAEGILVVDDTGFIKQGKKSCGVKRQYTGTVGKVANCQIGVFLTYASTRGHSAIDRRLYIPKEWIEDTERRKEAGVPKEAKFQTKPEMGLEMIQEATKAGVAYRWVTGDSAYGDYTTMRHWLEENGKYYVLNISRNEYIYHEYVGNLMSNLPSDGWFEASCGDGSKGARVYDWQILATSGKVPKGFKRVMLVRRSKNERSSFSKPDEMKAYIAFAGVDTPDTKLVEVAGTRWTVETCFKESKGEVGLDHYEVRSYGGWYKHITFALIALAFLTVLSANSLDTKTFQEHNPDSSSLDDFKKGRNLRV